MHISRNKIELMAPVGSYESLQAAIQGGADSIYFGVEKLNMRSRSSNNFTFEDLKEITKVCRDKGIKSYLTLNIVIYNNEIEQVVEVVSAAKENLVDAVIAADIAVIQECISQGVNVHISTQANISNIQSVRFYSKFADVMVLARELNMEQVKEIYQAIIDEDVKGPSGKLVKIEMFAHGALCMSVSGKCYLSLHEHNKSANRGACYQTCRRGYEVKDIDTNRQLVVDNEFIMSPKDLCTIGFIDKMIDAGVSVFKIEGRARSPEYVKTVCATYNEAFLSVEDGTFSIEKGKLLEEKLKAVFNRGFWDGYYLGQKLGEWSEVYGSKATTKKEYVGKGMNYFSKLKVAEFLIEAGTLAVGDDILITGPTTGVVETKVKEIRVELKSVTEAQKGQRCSIPLDQTIRRSDKLYIIKNID